MRIKLCFHTSYLGSFLNKAWCHRVTMMSLLELLSFMNPHKTLEPRKHHTCNNTRHSQYNLTTKTQKDIKRVFLSNKNVRPIFVYYKTFGCIYDMFSSISILNCVYKSSRLGIWCYCPVSGDCYILHYVYVALIHTTVAYCLTAVLEHHFLLYAWVEKLHRSLCDLMHCVLFYLGGLWVQITGLKLLLVYAVAFITWLK